MKALYQLYTYYLSMSVCVAFSISIFLTLSFLWVLIFLFMYCNIVIFLLIIALGPAVKSGLHFLHSCVSERWPYQVLTAELANAVWILIFVLLTLGRRVTVVVLSFILSTALQRAAFTSSRQLRYEQAKHVDGLQCDSWILLKCFRSRVMAGSL